MDSQINERDIEVVHHHQQLENITEPIKAIPIVLNIDTLM